MRTGDGAGYGLLRMSGGGGEGLKKYLVFCVRII